MAYTRAGAAAKRVFDVVASASGLAVLLPVFVGLGLWVALESRGGVFYRQQRVGRFGRLFWVYKFRSMRPHADRAGLLTVGGRDPRVTGAGYVLRRYKLDELPQLFNVLCGDMSLVGPRPEVPRYVALYTAAQREVLAVRPGLTDLASIAYVDESDLLAQSPDPEATYIHTVLPAKLELQLHGLQQASFFGDLRLLLRTLGAIVRRK